MLEDEPVVMSAICATLRAHGYQVLEATTAAEAIAVSRSHKGRISLLIADVFLPDKSGVWAAVKLLDIFPAIRVLFISGMPIECWHSKDLLVLRALPLSVWRFLKKPFRASLLRDSVRELLEKDRDSFIRFGEVGAS